MRVVSRPARPRRWRRMRARDGRRRCVPVWNGAAAGRSHRRPTWMTSDVCRRPTTARPDAVQEVVRPRGEEIKKFVFRRIRVRNTAENTFTDFRPRAHDIIVRRITIGNIVGFPVRLGITTDRSQKDENFTYLEFRFEPQFNTYKILKSRFIFIFQQFIQHSRTDRSPPGV